MKTTLKILAYVLIVLALVATSCSKDSVDGPIGPQGTKGEQGIQGLEGPQGPAGQDGEALGAPGEQGPQGSQGPQGEDGSTGPAGPKGNTGANGEDGTDGTNGLDGRNGTNGSNGADGNANVRVYKYDVSGISNSNYYRRVIGALTSEVIANDVILSFVTQNNTNMTPLPCRVALERYDIYPSYLVGNFYMFFFESGTSNRKVLPDNTLKELKIVIIKSSTVTGKSTKESVLADLKTNGVDVNDYNAICDYYGLAY